MAELGRTYTKGKIDSMFAERDQEITDLIAFEEVRPETHGAVGDGTTSDTTAIGDAHAAAVQ